MAPGRRHTQPNQLIKLTGAGRGGGVEFGWRGGQTRVGLTPPHGGRGGVDEGRDGWGVGKV
jgi:hypothetical protein